MDKMFVSTNELAKMLGISRIAVYKQIRSGKIKATKRGRNFFIERSDLNNIFKNTLTEKEKTEIKKAVQKTVQDFGETLRLLGKT
ncbi:MAG: helix-turn-helix domain-containing protein [Candidatus Pacebacteria bacterium]|nr:helix-turn-helix domain-containing protein [Candidatus Paceibacterota bacterium]